MAVVDPVLIANAILTNAVVEQRRDGTTLDVRPVAFSYGISITSLPTDDQRSSFGPIERAEVIDTADATWQRDDVLRIVSFAGHVDAFGTPILPEITDYLVTAARRLPGYLPLMVLTLTGTLATA